MSDDERKPRLHIHTGGIILLIIILLILFKVDIKSKIKSPQFQKNVAYIEETVKTFWQDKILNPLKYKARDVFIQKTNEGILKWQDGVSKNLLKIPTDEELEKITN